MRLPRNSYPRRPPARKKSCSTANECCGCITPFRRYRTSKGNVCTCAWRFSATGKSPRFLVSAAPLWASFCNGQSPSYERRFMNEMNGHAEFEQLLSLVDASAHTRATRSIRRHVATCWKCRTRLEELQETVREFARYHEKVVLPNLPPVPTAWPDLRRRMQEADESSQMYSLWTRVSSYFSLPAPVFGQRLILGIFFLACCAPAFTIPTRP